MTIPRSYVEIARDAETGGADVRDTGDHAAYLAEQDRLFALDARRYDPPADPPRRRPDGTVICWDCWIPIPAERLAVLPHAVRCTGCQAQVEWADEQTRRVFGG